MISEVKNKIFRLRDIDDFSLSALEIFRYQAENNLVYNSYLNLLGIDIRKVSSIDEIPFLPAGFFKNHRVITGELAEVKIFESSGTSGSNPSRHLVTDLSLYEKSFLETFRLFYGDPSGYFIAALLPSYSDRQNSSLIFMMNGIIEKSNYFESGFYLENVTELLSNISAAKKSDRKILLLGVSFALLEMAEKFHPDLSGVIVMETGGMKGRRKEITRDELHSILKRCFNVDNIHSEYGMTELLSQAYSKAGGIFYTPPWMKILIRDPQDPLSVVTEPGRTGGINIIDLANINSCSFIATDDLGKLHNDGGFEVMGRLDNSDIRGCNLLV